MVDFASDMDMRLFNVLRNPDKTNTDKVQPLPRGQGKIIPSRKKSRGAARYGNETHGPVPAPVTSPAHGHGDDVVSVRRTPAGPHDPSRRTPQRGPGPYEAPASGAARDHRADGADAYRAAQQRPHDDHHHHQGDHQQQQQPHPQDHRAQDAGAFDYAVSGAGDYGAYDGGYAAAAGGSDGPVEPYQFVSAADGNSGYTHGEDGAEHGALVAFGGAGGDPYDANNGNNNNNTYAYADDPSGGTDAFSMAVQEAQHDGTYTDGDAVTADGGYAAGWHGDAAEQATQRTWLGVAEAAAFDGQAAPGGGAESGHTDGRPTEADQYAWGGAAPSSLRVPSAAAQYQAAPPPPSASHGSGGDGGVWTDRRIDERPEPEDPATIERQAKHAALLKLRMLEEQGVKLSRTFTMEDSHYDMEYEWDAYHHRRDHIESIQFVHEKIALVGLGVSLLNAAGGKFLKRKGGIIEPHVLKSKWEQTLDEHKGTIEALARKYYGPHAGSSAQSPEFRMASALAIGIGSAVAMSLCTGFFMGGDGGGGGGDDGGRDDRDRRRRRRDDRRPTLRKHRDAATSDTTGWRDAFGYGGSVPYPQPPSSEQPSAPPDQEPFSRAPPAGGGVAPSPSHAPASAQSTPWPYGDPPAYPLAQQQQQPQPHYPQPHHQPPSPTPQATPQMDPYAGAVSLHGAQPGAPSWSPQHQAYGPGSSGGVQAQVAEPVARSSAGNGEQRVAHMGASMGTARPAPIAAAGAAAAARAHHQQPPVAAAPTGRRAMGRVAKPR
ncbi:hypothetical protein [Pandoravirus japonicus]|uniref:Uncharacterized protein n=1 Tax=Pandoravirus japonicus TaxID=2823154 RepID=A0A811BR72_9VIRU|nr:hypothetical protein [Pandoravirus japonicus]